MPVRLPDPASLLKIYRSFNCGNLLSLHMLDVNKLTVADGTQAGAKFAGMAVYVARVRTGVSARRGGPDKPGRGNSITGR